MANKQFLPRESTCPACGHHVAVPFLVNERQPLATIAWPATEEAARQMAALPLEYVSCVDCGHVYNEAFSYDLVPYSDKPNLMFNLGTNWSTHLLHIRDEIDRRLPAGGTVIEIGHGDGSFLNALAERRPDVHLIGFDPNGCAVSGAPNVVFRSELFDPATDLPALRPDVIISRHVLEHLSNPLGFMQRIAFAASCSAVSPLLYIEVPCIDQAILSRRTVDFYFEHNSQFTTESFTRMLTRCAASIETIDHGYEGEVIFGFVRLGGRQEQVRRAAVADGFRQHAVAALDTIGGQLAELTASGRRVVIWGGTGKSAAFINRYGADAERFPWVVDSDPNKVGTFVPGAGQLIRPRSWLLEHPADVVIIPPQWRARDILAEMTAAGITAPQVLIEHDGRLTDFQTDRHPY